MKKFLLALALLLLVPSVWAEEYQLLPRVSLQGQPSLAFTVNERSWILYKKELRMGILRYDSPPYGMLNLRREYEGLSADYAWLVAHQLGLPVRVLVFDSPEAASAALERGEIDFTPSVNVLYDDTHFVMSDTYVNEKPVVVVKNSDKQPLPDDMANVRVAMVREYRTLTELKRYCPKAQFQFYDNYQDALSAVSFGHARVYVGNSFSVSQNLLNNMHVVRYSPFPAKKIGFVLNRHSSELLELINRALSNIPQDERLNILHQWLPSFDSIDQSVAIPGLTEEEKSWIVAHPVVDVMLYNRGNAAPVAFLDENGTLRGIVGDILTIATLKTGLHFSFSTANTTSEILKKVDSGEADMLASLTPSPERSTQLLFTRPYLRNAFALVVNSHRSDIQALPDLRGKTLAIIKNNWLEAWARQNNVRILQVENQHQLLSSVVRGQADAAVGILLMADYQINTHFLGKLKIVTTMGEQPAWLSFGVGKSEPILRDILDKVLLSIPPVEMENMANRWRPNDLVVVDNAWLRQRPVVITSAFFVLLLVVSLIIWALLLRREIRRKALLRRQLNDQLAQLRTLVTSMPFPVSLRDREGRLTYCNQRYLIETGVSWEDALGKTMLELPGLRHPDQAAFYHRQVLEVIATGNAIMEDRRYELWDNPNSSIGITVFQWMQPYHDSDGNVAGIIGGWLDISEREALFEELREAKRRAEDSNRAKSVFLSTMSHEIRTPMNAIIGMLDMALKKGQRGEHDLQALEVASESAESLVGLIGDILDLSRIEGGQLDYHPEPVCLGRLIDNLMKVFQGLAIDKNITLSHHLPATGLPRVIADPLRIKQVLSNLLNNAIKFTDRGGVTLTLQQTQTNETGKVGFQIEVQDSGIGIDAAQQAALFHPFGQAENRRSGTGLGLYISRNICEDMGGMLTLTSEKGVGTRVCATLTLPAVGDEVNVEAYVESEETPLPTLNVLVVDDNAANRMLLSRQLNWLGQQAVLAADGYEALKLWQQQRFDIIITDCNMPGLSGYQLTQIIRESEEEQERAPAWIIGFTASATHEVMNLCLEAGMNSSLFKPCSLASLAEAMRGEGVQSEKNTFQDVLDKPLEETLLRLLISTLEDDLSRLRQLHLPKHRREIADLAHRLVGSLRIARQPELAEACLQMEAQCRDQDNSPEQLSPALNDLLENLEHYLQQLHKLPTLDLMTTEP